MSAISHEKLTWAIDTLLDSVSTYESDPTTIYVSKETYKLMKRAVAKGRRYAKWQKIRKRQRRAAQRRHNRGEL